MAEYKFGDGMKKIFLAGVGAIALSAEKGSELIGELVKKGEITVEQGKDLNKDLQRSFKESMDKRGVNIDELTQKFSKMSSDELARIKEQIANAEKIISEKMKKADETLNDFADEAEEKVEEFRDAVDDAVEKAADTAEDVASKCAEKAEECKEKVEDAACECAEKAEDCVEKVEDAACECAEKAEEFVEEVKEAVEEEKPAEE